MTAAMPSKTDLMYEILYNPDFVPLPSRKVNVKTTTVDGKPSYFMKNHATGVYYDLDELTNYIWNLIDGKRTVTQIMQEVHREKPRVKEKTVTEMLLFFADSSLLVASFEQPSKKRLRVASAFEIDLTLIEHSNNFLQSIHSKVRHFLKRYLLWVTLAFVIVGAFLFSRQFVSIFGEKSNFQIMGSSVVGFFFYYFVALAPVIAIHEIAHGLALVHYGGQPGEMGAGIFYFGPMFYTETTDAWGLLKRERMMIFLAGNISTLLIGSIVFFVNLITSLPEPTSHILTMIAFYCFNMSLFNFAPPFETDGYYILSDAVNMPNLRRDSYGYLGSIIRRALGRQNKTKPDHLTNRKRAIFLGYALVSVTWISYIVFQSSIFLLYMGQDVAIAISGVAQSIMSSSALQASAVLIAALSVLYFGMQIIGYGTVFSVAVKKATTKPLQVEAIHDRDAAIFSYLPPQVPETLSNDLKTKLEKVARKFTSTFELIPIGRSCVTVLRLSGTKLALTQIREHLSQVENEFGSAYKDFIMGHKQTLEESTGIHAPNKVKLTNMLEQVASESADTGNSSANLLIRKLEEQQNEKIMYLLLSSFGTVWTIEVQPALEYDIHKELIPSLLVEDLTLTDLYNDVENFKKRVVYGFDSLAWLASDLDALMKKCLSQPDVYQCVTVLEPIKSRIVFAGRTEWIEKNMHVLAPIFVAQTFSGYFDNLFSETCFSLEVLNRTLLPSAKEMSAMAAGELEVLFNDLALFKQNKKLIDACIEESEKNVARINESLEQMKATARPSADFSVGLLDAIFNVNGENLEGLPGKIKEFKKKWNANCRKIEGIQERVEKEHQSRKPAFANEKSKMFRVYPLVIVLSMLLSVVSLLFSPLPLMALFLSLAVLSQIIYWLAFYRLWRSFHQVAKYPSQAFSRVHLFILALTQAVYEYAITENVLVPVET